MTNTNTNALRYLSTSEYMQRVTFRNNLRSLGISLVDKAKKNYKVLGSVLVGLGVLTFFIPFTTIPLMSLGCVLMGITLKGLKWDFKYILNKRRKNKGCLK